MSEYPDPDEEFELMYGDDLELLNEQNFDDEDIQINANPTVRKSLDFNSPLKIDKNVDKKKPPQRQVDLNSSFESCFGELQNSQKTKDLGDNIKDLNDIPTQSLAIEPPSSKKRTIDDLFGDIDDIFADELFEQQSSKKAKEDDKYKRDLELIEDILLRRKLNKEKCNITAVGIHSNQRINSTERDKRNLSYQVPKYPFVKVKSSEGQSVYVRFHSEDYEREESKRITKENSFKGVLGDGFKKIWEEAQELILKQQQQTMEQNSESRDIEMIDSGEQEKQLWVDLYKPRKYLELLSDESTNRTMLRWMKLWDKVVFNRNPKVKISAKVPDDNKKKFFNQFELNTKLDEYGRPEHKVALLCGPPGLGKTTLAHMVAKHAGYNVVEINASDDRSIEAFKTALETATQMRSVVDQEKRPNCIVFDEIDGAPQASIDFLIKFITGSAPTKGKKGKNKNQTQVLKRPIICICNDVYVPALRPLRQMAFVINFPQTSSSRLAERLMEIARRQQIKTDMGAMMALAEKSNNDIRSCLSVLHFYKAQNKPIGLFDIYKANIGQKDMQKGLFTVWQELFEIKRVKKSTGGTAISSFKERMQTILNTIGSFGDHDRVAQGVFENYPLSDIKDPTMEGVAFALDWFCFNDVIMKQIYSQQNYSLSSYLNYAFVVWHFVFASSQKRKLVYPTAGYEARTKETRRKAVVAEVLRGMSPLVRCYNASLPLLLDTLPLLLRIISPPFRPISLHLYSEEEKQSLLNVAGIMTDYNLNYIQERKPDGVYEFNLEPNIEEIVTFGQKDDKRKVLSYSNRQLVAREIEMEKMRRFEAHMAKQSGKSKKDQKTSKEDAPKTTKPARKETEKNCFDVPDENTPLPNHLQTLRSKALKSDPKVIKATVRKDFFGRVIEGPKLSPMGKQWRTIPFGGNYRHLVPDDINYRFNRRVITRRGSGSIWLNPLFSVINFYLLAFPLLILRLF